MGSHRFGDLIGKGVESNALLVKEEMIVYSVLVVCKYEDKMVRDGNGN